MIYLKENDFTSKMTRHRWYSAETKTDSDSAGCIGLYINANKIEIMCFKQGVTSTLSGNPLRLVDQFTYVGSNTSSTESDLNIHITMVWTATERLSII